MSYLDCYGETGSVLSFNFVWYMISLIGFLFGLKFELDANE